MSSNDGPHPVQRLAFVLPSYGLDDFPSKLDESVAADLHAAWTCLWHPALIAHAGAIPEWKRADGTSLDVESALIICPKASEAKVDAPIRERLELHGCVWITSQQSRLQNLQKIAEAMSFPAGHLDITPMAQQLFALGYAFLQLQLLTRRLRYSSNLDQPLFVEQAIEAAKAAMRNDSPEFERWIQSAFDQLAQDRDHYYSQSAYLVDLTLLAKTTLGGSLDRQLRQAGPQNILASASLLRTLKSKSPENFELLRAANSEGTLDLVGGLEFDTPLAFQSASVFRRELARGEKGYSELGLKPPKVFSQFAAFMPADAPRQLKNHGMQGSILSAFSEGSYPEGRQAKITWEAADGTGIDSIAHHILDGSSANSFLAIGAKLGEQLDYHQVPTVVIAHWPGLRNDYWDDFQIVTKRTPALGIWKSVDEYFSTTQRPYHQDRLACSEFRPPSPIAGNATVEALSRANKDSNAIDAATTLEVMTEQIKAWLTKSRVAAKPPQPASVETANADGSPIAAVEPSQPVELAALDIHTVAAQVDRQLNPLFGLDVPESAVSSAPVSAVSDHLAKWTEAFREVLPRNRKSSEGPGLLIFNPYSGPMRCFLDGVQGAYTPSEASRIYASHSAGGTSSIVVDVPPLGIARVDLNTDSRGTKMRGPLLAQGDNLVNEFFEAHFHTERGYLKAIYLNGLRGNRASAMLTLGGLDAESHAAVRMQCDKFEIVETTPVTGRIRTTGKLIEGDRVVLDYRLDYVLWRGSRILEIQGSVSNVKLSKAKYLAWRWAWPTETSIFSTWHCGSRTSFGPLGGYTPTAIEVDDAEHRMLLLTSELPLQRKASDRFIDSIITFEDSGSRSFRLGIGVNCPRPYQASLEWSQPAITCSDNGYPLSVGNAAWFLQVNMPSVSVTPIDALLDEDHNVCGMRVQIHETEGKSGTAKVRCFRSIESADRVDYHGTSLGKLIAEDDGFSIAIRSNELSQVDIRWKRA
jgi:alpha-mannosidase